MATVTFGALLDRVDLGRTPLEQVQAFLRRRVPAFRAPTTRKGWRQNVARLRREALSKVYLWGWPKSAIGRRPRVVWGPVLRPAPDYVIRKLRYEACPGYWVPALLYEPRRLKGRVPAVLNANGHHEGGKAVPYKQVRCINLARRRMLALNFEFPGMGELGEDRLHNNIAVLDLAGLAGVGLFYLAMKKGLDVLLAHPHADRKRVGMTGLSGGGWQTIVLSSLDPRVTLSVPVAGYTSIRNRIDHPPDVGDLEQTPADLTTVLDYQDMTAMLAPRPALLILNERDECCFVADRTKPIIYDAVRPTYRALGAADRFECHVNTDPGTHNYDADNRSQLYRFLNTHFGLDTPETDAHHQEEILTEPELNVGLPVEQLSVRAIARARARAAAAKLRTPRTAAQRRSLRKRLADVIRLPKYPVRGRRAGRAGKNVLYRLDLGPWQLPAVVEKRSAARTVELVVRDCRDEPFGVVGERAGTRVVAGILGTAQLPLDIRYLMMIRTCGERLLGVQAAQLLAIARFARRLAKARRVRLVADGPRCALAGLVAAALEPGTFESLTATGTFSTLLHLFDRGANYEELRAAFCPRLLDVADIPQLVALLEGVTYLQPERCAPAIRGSAG